MSHNRLWHYKGRALPYPIGYDLPADVTNPESIRAEFDRTEAMRKNSMSPAAEHARRKSYLFQWAAILALGAVYVAVHRHELTDPGIIGFAIASIAVGAGIFSAQRLMSCQISDKTAFESLWIFERAMAAHLLWHTEQGTPCEPETCHGLAGGMPIEECDGRR